MLKILCVGPQWRGSNAGGLFRAFSRVGQVVSVIDENYYINLSNKSFFTKFVDRLLRASHISEFNQAILAEAESFQPDVVFVYKGAFVKPETLVQLKSKKILLINFYPDVSFHTHGSLLAHTLPLYDHTFTTKTFGLRDMKEQLGIESSSFVPHGFDPDIHKYIDTTKFNTDTFKCDVSFIGGWSKKKEGILSAIKSAHPNIDIKIWGGRWENCTNPELKSSIQNKSILGDLYTIGILSSKINLGLLHEKVTGASSGDLITSRTFHIPGAGGFMLHERSSEIALYFKEEEEIACFADHIELVNKISYYLSNDTERNRIAINGHKKALRDHSLDARARLVLEIVSKLKNA